MPTASRVRLTDQALVAVHLARSLAADGRATVAHLVVGLCQVEDGLAGHHVATTVHAQAAVRLCDHPGLTTPGLPGPSAALVALPLDRDPAWTTDLLRAALRAGGRDLQDLLDHVGLALGSLVDGSPGPPADPAALRQAAEEGEVLETFGRGSLRPTGFGDAADLAVARARAHGSTTRSLIPLLGLSAEDGAAFARLPAVDLEVVIDHVVGGVQTPGGHPVDLSDLTQAILTTGLRELG